MNKSKLARRIAFASFPDADPWSLAAHAYDLRIHLTREALAARWAAVPIVDREAVEGRIVRIGLEDR